MTDTEQCGQIVNEVLFHRSNFTFPIIVRSLFSQLALAITMTLKQIILDDNQGRK